VTSTGRSLSFSGQLLSCSRCTIAWKLSTSSVRVLVLAGWVFVSLGSLGEVRQSIPTVSRRGT
jgi:hypothetical protein